VLRTRIRSRRSRAERPIMALLSRQVGPGAAKQASTLGASRWIRSFRDARASPRRRSVARGLRSLRIRQQDRPIRLLPCALHRCRHRKDVSTATRRVRTRSPDIIMKRQIAHGITTPPSRCTDREVSDQFATTEQHTDNNPTRTNTM